MSKILIIEDDNVLSKALREALSEGVTKSKPKLTAVALLLKLKQTNRI